MSQREERFEIDVDASPAEVWERLTTVAGLTSWFGTRASIELHIDGERVVGWGEAAEMAARITDIEPQHRLRVVYMAEGERTGAEEWLITTDDKTTRLTLINSFDDDEIDDWEGFFGDIRRGWRLFLASLVHGLESAATPDREVECIYVAAPGPREAVWDEVETILAGSPEAAGGLHPVVMDPPHSRLLVDRHRTLLIDVEGSGDGQVLYVQAATHAGPSKWRSETVATIRQALRADVAGG
jgi:uncharacterized protein YndB with AHSA1/START domain